MMKILTTIWATIYVLGQWMWDVLMHPLTLAAICGALANEMFRITNY